jgi:hypothetical protein
MHQDTRAALQMGRLKPSSTKSTGWWRNASRTPTALSTPLPEQRRHNSQCSPHGALLSRNLLDLKETA